MVLVFVPVGYRGACHPTLYGCLGNGCRHFSDEARVDRFRNEVRRTESKVVYLICVVNDIGHRLLCQVGNGVDGGKLHLLVYGRGMNVESASEDIRETDNVVNLVRIVRTAGRHEHVGTAGHGFLI